MSGNNMVKFAKTILFVKPEQCKKVYEFYDKFIGLKTVCQIPNYAWCEFDTGAQSLCIHAEIDEDQHYSDRTGTHLVFQFDTEEEIDNLHRNFLDAGYELNEDYKTIKTNEVFKLAHNEKAGLHFFIVGDPAGHIVQCETKIQELS